MQPREAHLRTIFQKLGVRRQRASLILARLGNHSPTRRLATQIPLDLVHLDDALQS